MSRRPQCLIAGGGIGGLTSAIILARSGLKTALFEQAPTFTDIGAGIQLSPNAMQVYDALACAPAIIRDGFEPETATLRGYKTGRPALTTPLKALCRARYGQPYIHIHRADLQAVLVKAAKETGVQIYMGHKISAYEQNQDRISLITHQGKFEGDVLIGADGIKSNVRAVMQGEAEAARFTGQTAWRGLIPAGAIKAASLAPAANVWMGPGRHFVAYYVKGGTYINFVAVEERESWTEESWARRGDIAALKAAFAGWDDIVGEIISACKTPYEWGLFDRPPLARWSDGRAVLLGDAAHPILPFMAQGAAMAIEDSWVLAREIIMQSDIKTALCAYQSARQARTVKLQNISRENANMFHASSPIALTIRGAKLAAASRMTRLQNLRLDPIYAVNTVKTQPLGFS